MSHGRFLPLFLVLALGFPAVAEAATPSISAGNRHSVALNADGTVRAWGANGQGQLGDGSGLSMALPTRVPGLAGIAEVSDGGTARISRPSP